VEGLIYKKAPVLMEHHPEMAVDLFLSKKLLNPAALLPALYRYARYGGEIEREIRCKLILLVLLPLQVL
jgi:hypothetical protein